MCFKIQQCVQVLEIFLSRFFPCGEGVVPRFLLSPLEVGLDSVLFLSALGMPPLSLRIFEAAVHSDSFLCPDLGLESEHDFDSVSKRAVEITLFLNNIQVTRLGKAKNSTAGRVSHSVK